MRASRDTSHQSSPVAGESSKDFLPKKRTLRPSVDQTGLSAVTKPSLIFRGCPPVDGTVNTAVPGVRGPPSQGPVQYAMLVPSGEKDGRRPPGATRRASPPNAGMTKTPPPLRVD